MFKSISFTGIDKRTDINELVAIHEKWPMVEFGVLISEAAKDNNRYPDLILLQRLKNKNLNLALHVCGKLAKNAVTIGSLEEIKNFVGPCFNLFQRIQLNVVGHTSTSTIKDTLGKQIIIQTNLDNPKSKNTFNLFKDSDVVFLSDKSGGRGEVTDFDFFELPFQGFAGGLNPDNIIERKEEIDILCDGDYWLDMESGVRTNDWFDTNKVRRICELVGE